MVLAGGLGTRIRDVLGDTPKALAPIGDRTFIDWKLDELRSNDVRHVILLLGKGSPFVIEHVDRQKARWPAMTIDYVLDGDSPLGTGGAVRNSVGRVADTFFLTYGDSLLDLPYMELESQYASGGELSVMSLTSTVGPADSPNAATDGKFVTTYRKGAPQGLRLLDYGLLLLRSDAVRQACSDLQPPFDLSICLSRLADAHQLLALETSASYWEIGTPTALEVVRREFEKRSKSLNDILGGEGGKDSFRSQTL